MERLWTPWRMAYVAVEQPPGCVFCTRPAGEDDRRHLVLCRGECCFLILNLFPYNNGHLMVSPYRHTADLTTLTPAEEAELARLTRYSVRLLTEAYHPDGFNLGMNLGRSAGAGVADHLHMHVVPRWNGDTSFMAVVSGTKVLPEELFGTYDRLAETMARIGPPE